MSRATLDLFAFIPGLKAEAAAALRTHKKGPDGIGIPTARDIHERVEFNRIFDVIGSTRRVTYDKNYKERDKPDETYAAFKVLFKQRGAEYAALCREARERYGIPAEFKDEDMFTLVGTYTPENAMGLRGLLPRTPTIRLPYVTSNCMILKYPATAFEDYDTDKLTWNVASAEFQGHRQANEWRRVWRLIEGGRGAEAPCRGVAPPAAGTKPFSAGLCGPFGAVKNAEPVDVASLAMTGQADDAMSPGKKRVVAHRAETRPPSLGTLWNALLARPLVVSVQNTIHSTLCSDVLRSH